MAISTTPDPASYTPGFSLPQHLYLDEAQYRRDVRWLSDNLWFLVDHETRIPRPGDFFLYEYANESIIILRDHDDHVRAHYNVCRHRGARVCTAPSGRTQALVCPYHAWTYALDGRLRTAPFMHSDFVKDRYGLPPCHVRVHCGLIFISLASSPPDFSAFVTGTASELELHDIAHAKISHRALISTAANWKLVVQNNLECYHCRPAHPTYWDSHPGTLGPPNDGDPPLIREAPIEPEGNVRHEAALKFAGFQQSPDAPYLRLGIRRLIGEKFVTESVGGAPVAPLMGRATYDGFYIGLMFSPLNSFIMNPDYTVFYNFIPRSVRRTDIEVVWLVKGTAVEGQDFDIARLIDVWDTTLKEDKALVENNQLGVESDVYRPGPYSTWEAAVGDFDQRYVTHVVGQRQ